MGQMNLFIKEKYTYLKTLGHFRLFRIPSIVSSPVSKKSPFAKYL